MFSAISDLPERVPPSTTANNWNGLSGRRPRVTSGRGLGTATGRFPGSRLAAPLGLPALVGRGLAFRQ